VVLVDLNKEGLNEVYELLTKDNEGKHMQVCGDVGDSKFSKKIFEDVMV